MNRIHFRSRLLISVLICFQVRYDTHKDRSARHQWDFLQFDLIMSYDTITTVFGFFFFSSSRFSFLTHQYFESPSYFIIRTSIVERERETYDDTNDDHQLEYMSSLSPFVFDWNKSVNTFRITLVRIKPMYRNTLLAKWCLSFLRASLCLSPPLFFSLQSSSLSLKLFERQCE